MFLISNKSTVIFKWTIFIILIGFIQSEKIENINFFQSNEENSRFSLILNRYFHSFSINEKFQWQLLYSIIGSIFVGLSGVAPFLIISPSTVQYLRSTAGIQALNRCLSFAFGSIIGDVFVHLLPEAWSYISVSDHKHNSQLFMGIWVIIGFLLFLIIEKIFIDQSIEKVQHSEGDNYYKENDNGVSIEEVIKNTEIQAEGYLNLLANFIDNFTHGLAVGGSFLISFKIGVLTTICILVHEIPHEVTDFVILLRAGFDRWKAAKWQFLTATGSLLGAIFALTADASTTGRSKCWILPLTSGAFIYIAMVSLLPEILSELSPRESLIQMFLVLVGFLTMVVLSHHCG